MRDAADVVVLGSANVDVLLGVAELPRPGETVLAARAARACGGKGANQAIAAARAGARTCLLGAVGADADGELLRATLREAGVALDALRIAEAATGTAIVLVDDHGENSIVVVPGANAEAAALDAAELARVRDARVLLGQLETPQPRFVQAARAARRQGVRVLLNAAPSGRPLDDDLWPLVDLLVVNEHEAAELGGGAETAGAAAQRLLERVPCVVVTLGAAGVLVADCDGLRASLAAPEPARVVDTTGAGDAFCGVLAASLARGLELLPAVENASAAGSLAVEASGAEPSIPTADAIAARRRAAYGRPAGP
jgi:ribokinase